LFLFFCRYVCKIYVIKMYDDDDDGGGGGGGGDDDDDGDDEPSVL